jgi:hypothetical protein
MATGGPPPVLLAEAAPPPPVVLLLLPHALSRTVAEVAAASARCRLFIVVCFPMVCR